MQGAVVVKTVLGSHFGVGEFTTLFRTYLSGDWDVHWRHDLDFDPWPGNIDSAGLDLRNLTAFSASSVSRAVRMFR